MMLSRPIVRDGRLSWDPFISLFIASGERGSTINIVPGAMNFRHDHGVSTRVL